ncbi:MAG: CDP-alcohol phosphatidyltransferase family protein [Deltaproteobacteria bacterium]|nr:CDP-alcohol phosphatidyltransferase family protein [Deltaproteobacteria bacterium]
MMNSSISILLIVYALFLVAMLSSYFYFIFFQKEKHKRDRELGERGESFMVNRTTREWWLWITAPLEEFFIRKKISPNMISLYGLIFAFGSCMAYGFGLFVLGGWCVLLGGTMDIFDGRVARRTGQVSATGDFWDANLDRMGEALMYLGLLNYYANQLFFYVVFVAFFSAMMISYSKARAGQLGLKMTVGVMQRAERIVWIGVPSAISPLFASLANYWLPISKTWLASVGIAVVALLGMYTYYERYSFIHKHLEKK